MPYLIVAVLAALAPAAASPVSPASPQTPLQLCATKALAGQFGKLKPWQANAYRRALDKGATRHRALVTVYGPWEGYDRNEGCAYGYGCSEDVAAANALTGRTVIWLEKPAGLRVIGDTGADWNDPKARRLGCEFWVDLWIPKLGWRGLNNTLYRRNVWVIAR